jgi:hypothetical protein
VKVVMLSWPKRERQIERKNNSGLNDPSEFYKLDHDTQKKLLDWIDFNLTERNHFNRKITSYGLKHMLPFYVTNGEFKGAMLEAGYKVLDKTEMNWNFNVYVRRKRYKKPYYKKLIR